MVKNVIHIFGASGSGTSTLGRKICDELDFTFMDTDDYFWADTDPKYIKKRPAGERLELMWSDIEKSANAVISGSLDGWGDELIPVFTLAVRLETDTDVRISRLKSREREKFGDRIAPGGDMYEIHNDFIRWARLYDTGGTDMRSRARHDRWQKLLRCPLIKLSGTTDLDENFEAVKRAIAIL